MLPGVTASSIKLLGLLLVTVCGRIKCCNLSFQCLLLALQLGEVHLKPGELVAQAGFIVADVQLGLFYRIIQSTDLAVK